MNDYILYVDFDCCVVKVFLARTDLRVAHRCAPEKQPTKQGHELR